jgi:acetyltransferase-like isoleucine patch superfamily enzyme
MTKQRKFTVGENLGFDLLALSAEGALYFCACAGPCLLLWTLREAHPLALLATALACWPVAAFVFIGTAITVKRVFLRRIPEGRFFATNRKVRPWAFAQVLKMSVERSPFLTLINTNLIFRQIYYRGMGAQMAPTVFTGIGVKITDPWALEAGEHVIIGQEALIAGHKTERDVITLEPVILEPGAVVGARAVVQAGVRIGANAVVGANSVVWRGTVIPAGETWAGNPACKVQPLSSPAREAMAAGIGCAIPSGGRETLCNVEASG